MEQPISFLPPRNASKSAYGLHHPSTQGSIWMDVQYILPSSFSHLTHTNSIPMPKVLHPSHIPKKNTAVLYPTQTQTNEQTNLNIRNYNKQSNYYFSTYSPLPHLLQCTTYSVRSCCGWCCTPSIDVVYGVYDEEVICWAARLKGVIGVVGEKKFPGVMGVVGD